MKQGTVVQVRNVAHGPLVINILHSVVFFIKKQLVCLIIIG